MLERLSASTFLKKMADQKSWSTPLIARLSAAIAALTHLTPPTGPLRRPRLSPVAVEQRAIQKHDLRDGRAPDSTPNRP